MTDKILLFLSVLQVISNAAGNTLLCGQRNKEDEGTLELLFCPCGELLDIWSDNILLVP